MMADVYLTDEDNTRILQEIYHGDISGRPGGVSDDRIILSYKHASQEHTRQELVNLMLARYDQTISGASQSAKQFLFDTAFTETALLNSLYYPTGYSDFSGWSAWAGSHQGTWYNDDGACFQDHAKWHPAQQSAANSAGTPYWHQPVTFYDGGGSQVSRHGWNQSNADIAYLWGWDPKGQNTQPDDGNVGAHLGFQHSENQANAIFWFTKNECFFEAVRTHGGQTRRISVGLWGRGLWSII